MGAKSVPRGNCQSELCAIKPSNGDIASVAKLHSPSMNIAPIHRAQWRDRRLKTQSPSSPTSRLSRSQCPTTNISLLNSHSTLSPPIPVPNSTSKTYRSVMLPYQTLLPSSSTKTSPSHPPSSFNPSSICTWRNDTIKDTQPTGSQNIPSSRSPRIWQTRTS